MSSFTEIVVVGVGGVGGYFGTKLAKYANSSNHIHVTFVARGDHFKNIKEKGLVLKLRNETISCITSRIVNSIDQISKANIIFICTKSYDLDQVIQQLSYKLTHDTIVIPLLNGFNIYDRIKQVLSQNIVLPACTYINGKIIEPGVVAVDGSHGKIVLGSDPSFSVFDYSKIQNLLQLAEIKYFWVNNPFFEVWKKYIFVASFAIITAAYNATFYEITQNDFLLNELKLIMNEIINIAQAKQINISNDIFEWAVKVASSLHPNTTTSFHNDLKNGKKNEKDIFIDDLINEGAKYHIETTHIKNLGKKLEIQYHK